MAKLFESDDYLLTNVVLLFLLINFNLEIGTIYFAMVMIDWFAYYLALDRNAFKLIPLERDKKKRMYSLIVAMGVYVAFIFAVNFISSRFSAAPTGSYESVFEYVSALIAATFSATPILYGSSYIKLIVWGVLIPIVETRFFFRTLLQWGIQGSSTPFPKSIFSANGFFIMGFFGALFAVFHIVAKGITNNTALSVTFIFGALSSGLVLHFREYLVAVFLHIITNTVATMQQLGLGFFNPSIPGFNSQGAMILGGIMLVSWFLLFQQLPFINAKPRYA